MNKGKESLEGKLICSYSSSRAKKDAHDRTKIIEKLTKKLGNGTEKKAAKTLISNSGYLKYTTVEDIECPLLSPKLL